MKLKYGIVGSILAVLALVYGCELITEKDSAAFKTPVGDDLIINEVFTISPDKFYSFSWIEILNPTERKINWYKVEEPATGWAVGANGTVSRLVESFDGWTPNHTDVVPKFNGIGYLNPETLYAAGDAGKIYRSNDAGLTWFALNQTLTSVNFNAVSVIPLSDLPNAKIAWVCGDSGTVLRTINRGDTWNKQTSRTRKRLRDIVGLSTALGYACGDSVILKYGSNVWDTLPNVPRKEIFKSIRFPELDFGRVAGAKGVVMYTTNGGGSWEVEQTGVTTTLNSICYLTANNVRSGHAWAVGDAGTIIKVDSTNADGKATWKRVTNNAGVTENLNYVEFVDTLIGYAWGDGGVMIVSTDGGNSWRRQNSGTTENLYAGVFITPSLIEVLNYYALAIYAERRQIFVEVGPNRAIFNPDFIVGVDTGSLIIFPTDHIDGLREVYNPIERDLTIASGGFAVINSDSLRFEDHTRLGPSKNEVINLYLGIDTSGISLFEVPKFYRWNLMPGSEVRLLKIYEKSLKGTGQQIAGDIKIIDIVRFGDYTLAVDYPNNKPAPAIPEWWSISRYADLVTTDLNTFSSDKYFYLTEKPIPGWASQLRSK